MNILYFSDLHLPLGPREPIRPEMRRMWCRFGYCGEKLMDKFEDQLREEARGVRHLTDLWMERHASGYDLLINGGDNAMPLSQHKDRLDAARTVWASHLELYGEERYITLTGNHELGHGYESEPDCYPDLQALREQMFSRDINRKGFGTMTHGSSTLLFLDSELISMSQLAPAHPLILHNMEEMAVHVQNAVHADGPISILTHNTARARKWVRRMGVWADLVKKGRKVFFIGGHFHVPRITHRDGAEVHWSGGGSYPEPWLRYLIRVPFTGVQRGGPGAIEIILAAERMRIRHRHFGVHLGLFKKKVAA